jgi:hypothetical protein
MNLLARLVPYSFVVTILWIGFLLAISVMETPLRFQPEAVSLTEALSIGRLVFHALNAVELMCATLLVIAVGTTRGPQRIAWLLTCIVVLLLLQTGLLFTVLDQRTAAVLRGEEVAPAMYHALYIGLDGLKLLLLIGLAILQIRDFEKRARSG